MARITPPTRLRGLIRGVCDNTDLTDPREIAAAAVRQLDDDDLRVELEQAAISTAREVMSGLRTGPLSTDDPAGQRDDDPQRVHAGRVPNPSRHGRTALVRNWVAERMRSRLHVGGEWKLLRDCTLADLAFAAEERRINAARNVTEAERYDRLGKAVADAGAATVADLDEAAFATAWGQP